MDYFRCITLKGLFGPDNCPSEMFPDLGGWRVKRRRSTPEKKDQVQSNIKVI